jgi:hypothetical protein
MAVNPLVENSKMAAEGLANLAHALRRSTALYVAMQITPPESSVKVLLDNADVLAAWLNGRAGATPAAPTPPPAPGAPPQGEFLGINPWE